MGLAPGDVLVIALPNIVDTIAVYFAAMQTGLYIVAINWHLAGPEIGYILSDSGAKALVAHGRFGEASRVAADEAGLAADRRFAVGVLGGFTPLSMLGVDEPATRPDVRTQGAAMLYTSGTTGKPKGVQRRLTGADPDAVCRLPLRASSPCMAWCGSTVTCTSAARRCIALRC